MKTTALLTVAALALVVAVPLLATGCGANSPEQAVRNFMKAFDDGDFNAFLSSVLPENVHRMTDADALFWKDEAFGTVVFEEENMQMETKYLDEAKNKAEVTVTSGKIVIKGGVEGSDIVLDLGKKEYTSKDPNTGKETTQPFTEREQQIVDQLGKFPTEKYKNAWYVDFVLERGSDVEVQ